MGGGPPCFPQGFTCLVVLWIPTPIFCFSLTGLLPSMIELSNSIQLSFRYLPSVRNPSQVSPTGLGSFPFARRYLGNRCFFLLLGVLRCFSSPGIPSYDYLFIIGYLDITPGEFPHSDICGSRPICDSPQLNAAYHVLLRLLVPRHPPYALSSLIILIFLRKLLEFASQTSTASWVD